MCSQFQGQSILFRRFRPSVRLIAFDENHTDIVCRFWSDRADYSIVLSPSTRDIDSPAQHLGLCSRLFQVQGPFGINLEDQVYQL